jgi:hypothetical protein
MDLGDRGKVSTPDSLAALVARMRIGRAGDLTGPDLIKTL